MRLFTGIALPDNIRKQIDEDAGRLKFSGRVAQIIRHEADHLSGIII